TAGTCNPATGTCSNPAKPDGASCNDGNACTQTDTCRSAKIGRATRSEDSASEQCHTAGTCNPAPATCSKPTTPAGAAGNDGNACTQTATCRSGSCVGTEPVVRTASDQCHTAGTCNPATGTCSNPAKPDGASCNDGNACTQTDTCRSASCVGAEPVVCTAVDRCHGAGTCDPGPRARLK